MYLCYNFKCFLVFISLFLSILNKVIMSSSSSSSSLSMYMDCPKCKSTLQYPSYAKLIRCPSCHYIANTTAPQHLPCISCHTLLTFPPHSLYIRCPKCFVTIQFRDHQYKNELLNHNKPQMSFKLTKNIKYSTPQNIGPLIRINIDNDQKNNYDKDEMDYKKNQNDNHKYAPIYKDMVYSISNQQQKRLHEICLDIIIY